MASTPRCVSPTWLLTGAVVLSALALSWYALAVDERVYTSTGTSYPGPLTAVAEPVCYFLLTLLGAVTFGGLVHIVVTARPDDRGVIDAPAFGTHLLVERTSTAWVVVAALAVAVQAASDAGTSALQLVADPTALVSAVQASEMARAACAVTLVAAAIAVAVRVSLRWVTHAVVLIPAFVGVVALPVSGNAGQGPDHDYATSSAIVFAVALAAIVGVKVTAALDHPDEIAARRVLILESAAGAVVLGYGVVVFTLLVGPGNPLSTAYGVAGIGSACVLLAMWSADVLSLLRLRRTRAAPCVTQRVLGAVGGIAVVAAVASMATQPAPRFLTHRFTTWDIFLGYELPQPPSVANILMMWRFDTFLGVAAVAMAAAYTVGYLRLRRRGDTWPVGRLLGWFAGCAMMLFTTSSGVKAYGSAMFSVHMAEHMTLNMFVPVLLVLGGPVTLALRALPASGGRPGPREWIQWLIHSRFTAFLSHPITAFVLFVASLYAVYFTPIFDTLVRYHWGHELMSLHFLLVGYLFFWGIIGIDPGPRRLPFLGRLGLLFAVMPFHAFFGIATMSMTSLIGGQFYRYVDIPWIANLQQDQHLGGAIAWGSSELPVIIVVVALVAQWARQDRRTASRSDRHADADYADDELEAYNAMLRELARHRN
jgi:cytochrome c oxidase assembly factor CtaG